MPKRKNSPRTSAYAATVASKIMRDGRYGADAKSAAASALRNRAKKA